MAVQLNGADGITQIIYLHISEEKRLGQADTHEGRLWDRALDVIVEAEGFRRLYWGRRLEEPEKVQLHIVWDSLHHGNLFSSSQRYHRDFLPVIKTLADGQEPQTRHATLRNQVPDNPFGPEMLGFPIGTAIYLGTDAAWHEGAWPLWTHVVRHVDGCKGIAGGSVVEPVGGLQGGYLVYVAWESVGHHKAYHRTQHFARLGVILGIGNKGWVEYGHVVFEEIREGKKGAERSRL